MTPLKICSWPFYRIIEDIANLISDKKIFAVSPLTNQILGLSLSDIWLERNTGDRIGLLSFKTCFAILTTPQGDLTTLTAHGQDAFVTVNR